MDPEIKHSIRLIGISFSAARDLPRRTLLSPWDPGSSCLRGSGVGLEDFQERWVIVFEAYDIP